jgi:hypothetical protein
MKLKKTLDRPKKNLKVFLDGADKSNEKAQIYCADPEVSSLFSGQQ